VTKGVVALVAFASERGFGSVKSRSLAALGMTTFLLADIEAMFSTFG
jgi:hypothetical protein